MASYGSGTPRMVRVQGTAQAAGTPTFSIAVTGYQGSMAPYVAGQQSAATYEYKTAVTDQAATAYYQGAAACSQGTYAYGQDASAYSQGTYAYGQGTSAYGQGATTYYEGTSHASPAVSYTAAPAVAQSSWLQATQAGATAQHYSWPPSTPAAQAALAQHGAALYGTQTPPAPVAAATAQFAVAAAEAVGLAGMAVGQQAAPVPEPVREVVLDCVHAAGLDVAQMALDLRKLSLEGHGPWVFGRAHQPELIERLVPNEAARGVISRRHFELAWQDGVQGWALQLRKLSSNVLLVDGVPAPAQELVTLRPGSQLGLCGPDGQVSVLTFRAQFSAEPPAGQQEPRSPPAQNSSHVPRNEAAKSQPSYELVVKHARGCDLGSLPEEARTVQVPAQGPMLVGRQHQPGLFESLLSSQPNLLTLISRSHFELAPDPSEPGAFKLTNLSGNILAFGQQRVGKGDSTVARPPAIINHLGPAGTGDKDTGAFISFELSQVGCLLQDAHGLQPEATHPASVSWATPPTQVKPTHAEVPQQQQQQQQQQHPQLMQNQQLQLQLQQQQQQQQHQTPPTIFGLHKDPRPLAEAAQPAHFALECTYSRGCDVDALALDKKAVKFRIDGKTVTVGRQNQPGLFEGLLGAEQQLLAFVSRAHFELAPVEGESMRFRLTNLSANPVVLDNRQVAKGEQRDVTLPTEVDFVETCNDPSATSPAVFLRLTFRPVQA